MKNSKSNIMKLEQKLTTLQHISLSSDEKEFLWSQIELRKNDFNYTQPIEAEESPYALLFKRLGFLFATPAFAFLLMVLSANAVPGQQLYSIKTGVNEPLQRLATVGERNKLELEKKLLSNRVAEAKVLKSLGQLDKDKADEIESRITKQANNLIAKQDNKQEAEETGGEDHNDIQQDIDIAELKGIASGSVDFVRVLSGQAVQSESNEDLPITKVQDKTTEPRHSGLLQPVKDKEEASINNTNISVLIADEIDEDDLEQSPEIDRIRLQAEAKISTSKAEAAQNILDQRLSDSTSKTGASERSDTGNKEGNESEEVGKRELLEITKSKISAAKNTIEQDSDEVDESSLLKVVEQTAAARVISQAFLEK